MWVLVKNLRKIIVIGLVLGLLLASFVYYAVGLDKEAGKENGINRSFLLNIGLDFETSQ